jgi:hypothetical protein
MCMYCRGYLQRTPHCQSAAARRRTIYLEPASCNGNRKRHYRGLCRVASYHYITATIVDYQRKVAAIGTRHYATWLMFAAFDSHQRTAASDSRKRYLSFFAHACRDIKR